MSASSSGHVEKAGSFKEVLAGCLDEIKTRQSRNSPTGQPAFIGKITTETPTVSELLIRHKEFGLSTWDIIYSEKNSSREYTKIRPGTLVYYSREKGTLSWSNGPGGSVPPADESAPLSSPPADRSVEAKSEMVYRPDNGFSSGSLETSLTAVPDLVGGERSAVEKSALTGGEQPISLGRIDNASPTVSHLLKNHPGVREQAWNVLAHTVNTNKPFHRLTKGTQVYLQTENMEITWKDGDIDSTISYPRAPVFPKRSLPNPGEPKSDYPPATDLSEAVKRYLGTPYDQLNCYELLVKGLDDMNIQYRGRDGLYARLTRMALDSGMAPNAYLNGEGVVKAAGALVLSKRYSNLDDWQDNAESLMKELEPLLDNGQILSFSTEKRGHTGVVSRQNKRWTFINSGRLDNSIYPDSVHRGVGEELLHKEIVNWFKLAHAKGETLSVTLGRVGQDKIHTAFTIPESTSRQT